MTRLTLALVICLIPLSSVAFTGIANWTKRSSGGIAIPEGFNSWASGLPLGWSHEAGTQNWSSNSADCLGYLSGSVLTTGSILFGTATISAPVDFSGKTTLTLKTGTPNYAAVRVYIDSTLVLTSSNDDARTESINVSAYSGIHTLKIELGSYASGRSCVDDITLIP